MITGVDEVLNLVEHIESLYSNIWAYGFHHLSDEILGYRKKDMSIESIDHINDSIVAKGWGAKIDGAKEIGFVFYDKSALSTQLVYGNRPLDGNIVIMSLSL